MSCMYIIFDKMKQLVIDTRTQKEAKWIHNPGTTSCGNDEQHEVQNIKYEHHEVASSLSLTSKE